MARLPRRHSKSPGLNTSAANCWRVMRTPTVMEAIPSLSGPLALMRISVVMGASPSLPDPRVQLWPQQRGLSRGPADRIGLASPSAMKLPPTRFRGVPARRRAHRKVPALQVATWPPLSVRGRQPASLRMIMIIFLKFPLFPPQSANEFASELKAILQRAYRRHSLSGTTKSGKL